jgi:hypothetical protein
VRNISRTGPLNCRSLHYAPPVGARDFFNLAYSLWLKNLEEHLITVIAGVLRLRATSRPLYDKSARRFAQDDGFVGGEKLTVSCAENTKKIDKVAGSRDDKGRVALPFGSEKADGEQQVPPLRFAPVGMTILLGTDKRTSRSGFFIRWGGPQAHDCFGPDDNLLVQRLRLHQKWPFST